MRMLMDVLEEFQMANRTLCDVLSEIRTCDTTKNYSYLLALVEEAQTMANRMEAALWDQKDFDYRREEHRKLKEDIKKLKQVKKDL